MIISKVSHHIQKFAFATTSIIGARQDLQSLLPKVEVKEQVKPRIVRHQSEEIWKLFEPDFSDANALPKYEKIDLSLRGYDFSVLERWQARTHKICRLLKLTVDLVAFPHKQWNVATYKPRSETVENEFVVKLYERVITITDPTTPQLAQLIQNVVSSQPQGTKMSIDRFSESKHTERLQVNKELEDVKAELASFDTIAVRRKKGWIID